MNTTILICDDNIAVHESLSVYLKEDHVEIFSAYTGEDALNIFRQHDISFIILDLMLPGKSGIDVLKEIRKTSDVPVLILSAKSSEFDRILGLELGADDYIAKPFSPREIATRVRVILKRTAKKQTGNYMSFSNLTIDTSSYTASIDGEILDLTPKELNILACLASAPGTVFSREQILNRVWGYDYYGDTRSVDTRIKHIRQKLPEHARFAIRSVYGVGYKLEET
ncbi:MAG: response regulator transcription factor [Clostridiales bacterium]|nr:response regulator transcription factor [Clostridiales bacterium]MCD8132897.1 response regulator transcription factor [Clostridiales bacterium]